MEDLIVRGIYLSEFLGIPYEASRHPGNVSVDEFLADPSAGANCQLLALVKNQPFHLATNVAFLFKNFLKENKNKTYL